MADEFEVSNLGSVANVRSGYAFRSGDMGDKGFPIIKIKNVVPPIVNIIDCERVPESIIAEIPNIERYVLEPGDILIAMTGATVGKIGRFPSTSERFYLNQRVGKVYLTAPSKADYRYLYYVLSQDIYIRQMFGTADGSAQANISGAQIERLEIPLPPLPEQRAIAHVLGMLDDKIELNRRMNETLETMARALFKSWFVDFDPVRAKAEGRWKRGHSLPGIPAHLYDLFPDRFVDSELGGIPAGWEVRELGDLLGLAYGKALKAEDRRDGNVPVYGSNGQVGWHDKQLAAGPGIVVGRKGNPGVVKWAPTDFFVIDTAFYVVPKAACRSLHFLFQVLQTHELGPLGADSAVPGLNRNLVYMSTQVLPPRPLLDTFDSFASALAARIHQCSEESRTLAAMRDAILPKIISGKLRVNDSKCVQGVNT